MKFFLLKIWKVFKNPLLIKNFLVNKGGFNFDLIEEKEKGIARKAYKDYKDYLHHQKSKLEKIKNTWLPDYDKKYRVALRERLENQLVVKSGMSVLCLAARIGTETKSFLDLGCFAIGVDLNPGKENKYVVYGDFHNLQFANKSVDAVFTNSLDHAFDIDKLLAEIKRVLKPGGFFVLEIGETRERESVSLKTNFEAISWKSSNIILEKISSYGFAIVKKLEFDYPWKGTHFSFILKSN
jgi:ubiquinone/menaquinone biosynthesis C-methylase UbiE